MRRLVTLVPIALVAVLVAGCGSGTLAPDALTSGSPSHFPGDTPPTTAPPPTGDTSSHIPGDTPPSGPPSAQPATSTPTVQNTCQLVTQDYIKGLTTNQVIAITFSGPSQETHGVDPLIGAWSHCYTRLTSQLSDGHGGKDFVGGEVTIKLQTAGSRIYFPPPADATSVGTVNDTTGNQYYVRNGRYYVQDGDGMVTVEVAIPNYTDTGTDRSLQDSWAGNLAGLVYSRIPH